MPNLRYVPWSLVACLAAVLATACATGVKELPTPVGLPQKEVAPSRVTPKAAARLTIEGTVVAPVAIAGAALIGNDGAALIGNDGAALLGNDGATLIGNDGAALVANHSGRGYHLTAAGSPLANCTVLVTDATGKPLPGFVRGKTGAKGRYRITGVPAGFTFRILVPVETASGHVIALQTLIRPSDKANDADVSAATTLVAVAVTRAGTKSPTLGTYDIAAFKKAADRITEALDKTPAALGDGAAFAARAKALFDGADDIGTGLARIAKDIETTKPALEDFLDAIRDDAPKAPASKAPSTAPSTSTSPSATPSFVPVPGSSTRTTPDEPTAGALSFDPVQQFDTQQDAHGWRYLFRLNLSPDGREMSPQAAVGGRGSWTVAEEKACQISTSGKFIVMRTGTVRRSPVLEWKAPGPGRAVVHAAAATTEGASGLQTTYEVPGQTLSVPIGLGDPVVVSVQSHDVNKGDRISFVTTNPSQTDRAATWDILVDFIPK